MTENKINIQLGKKFLTAGNYFITWTRSSRTQKIRFISKTIDWIQETNKLEVTWTPFTSCHRDVALDIIVVIYNSLQDYNPGQTCTGRTTSSFQLGSRSFPMRTSWPFTLYSLVCVKPQRKEIYKHVWWTSLFNEMSHLFKWVILSPI
jgi:hypothetical protein